MSNARRCDICGNYYDVPDHEMFLNEPWLNTSMVRILKLKDNAFSHNRFDDMKFDSCDKCLQDVLDYILSRAAVKE